MPRLQNPTKQVAYVWWIFTFLLTTLATVVSLTNAYRGVTYNPLELCLTGASWPVSCLLLARAIRGVRWTSNEPGTKQLHNDSLTEPLLDGEKIPIENEETPYASASPWSALLFSWLDPLLALGSKRPLQMNDVPHLSQSLQAHAAAAKFLQAWEAQREGVPEKQQSVIWALAAVYWKPMALNALCALGKTLALAFGPLILQQFIRYESGERLFEYEGYILVAALLLSKILESVLQRHWYAGARVIGMKLRSGLVATIYQKQFR